MDMCMFQRQFLPYFFFFCLAKYISDFQRKMHRENDTIYRWPQLPTLPSFSSLVPSLPAMMAWEHLRYIEILSCGPLSSGWYGPGLFK